MIGDETAIRGDTFGCNTHQTPFRGVPPVHIDRNCVHRDRLTLLDVDTLTCLVLYFNTNALMTLSRLQLNATKCETAVFLLNAAEATWQSSITIEGRPITKNTTPT